MSTFVFRVFIFDRQNSRQLEHTKKGEIGRRRWS